MHLLSLTPLIDIGIIVSIRIMGTQETFLHGSFGFRINRVARALGIQFGSKLKPLDLTPAQFAVLQDIDDHPGTAQNEISVRTGTDMPTLTELLLRMEQRGDIARMRDEGNRRRYIIHLCDQARVKLADARVLAAATNSSALAGLTAPEIANLFELLDRVEGNLK